ncbi:MAG: prolipoprotein diacylglyceryl transferase [Planctomycetes bacterium]|nr:prolipoprotein diacylglyceryl transferase [Planctomycetota bacterium]
MTLAALLQETAAAADTAVASAQFWQHDLSPDLVRIPFPKIGAIQDGIPIRFYSLAYLLGLLAAWWLLRRLSRQRRIALDETGVADLIIPYALLGVMLGGRLGYVLFYDVDADGRWAWLRAPWKVVQIWEGGMASHGGILGVLVAMAWFARRRGVRLAHLLDLCCLTAPIGLCLGRIANFINGELWGRATTVSWAVLFPRTSLPDAEFVQAHPELHALLQQGLVPRHPSQLYEALGEGLLLFLLLFGCHRRLLPRAGATSGLFLLVYGVARMVCELFREPDAQLGYGWLGMTRGQWLSVGMVAAGAIWSMRALRGAAVAWTPPPDPATATKESTQ